MYESSEQDFHVIQGGNSRDRFEPSEPEAGVYVSPKETLISQLNRDFSGDTKLLTPLSSENIDLLRHLGVSIAADHPNIEGESIKIDISQLDLPKLQEAIGALPKTLTDEDKRKKRILERLQEGARTGAAIFWPLAGTETRNARDAALKEAIKFFGLGADYPALVHEIRHRQTHHEHTTMNDLAYSVEMSHETMEKREDLAEYLKSCIARLEKASAAWKSTTEILSMIAEVTEGDMNTRKAFYYYRITAALNGFNTTLIADIPGIEGNMRRFLPNLLGHEAHTEIDEHFIARLALIYGEEIISTDDTSMDLIDPFRISPYRPKPASSPWSEPREQSAWSKDFAKAIEKKERDLLAADPELFFKRVEEIKHVIVEKVVPRIVANISKELASLIALHKQLLGRENQAAVTTTSAT